MNFAISATLALCLVTVAYGSSPAWDNLKISWYANPLNPWGFDSVPRTTDDTAKNNFAFKDDQCLDGAGKFVGKRYWYKEDPALLLLFDKNGIIAGVQTSVPKSQYNPYPGLLKYYIDDGDYWTLTSYFVDPSTICDQGRTQDDLKTQGTGTGLWMQYGPNALTDSYNIPLSESDIKNSKWGYGKCFWTMGQHYWYNVTKDMSCGDFLPNCLLYNSGKLTGFCFATNAALSSKRYDTPAPTPKVLDKFLDPVPDCVFSDPTYQKLSTIHVYFTDDPQLTSWC